MELFSRKKAALSVCLCLILGLAGCAGGGENSSAPPSAAVLTDWTGREVAFEAAPQRVVAVSGSLGEVWLNAGGTLIGTTQDAVTERNLDLGEDVTVVGTIKEPDLETILSLEPDFVILSADIGSHQDLAGTLEELAIPCGLFHEEYFGDYLALLGQFTGLTGRPDCYEEKGLRVEEDIGAVLDAAPDLSGRTVLLLRAYSTGFKAKNADNLAGTMLRDFGLENVLDKYDSLLEDISMEEIIRTDPDYIFVTTMGADTGAAIRALEEQLCSDPAWASLTAVKEGRYHILPKELFHYKPNARWGESYALLADLFNEN